MDCEKAREVLIDLIYQEETPELSPEFKTHFVQCSGCSAEYMELLETRRLLGSWKDEEPPTSLVIVPAKSAGRRPLWKAGWMALRPAPAFAFSLTVLLAFLAFANVRISWANGQFGFQSGIFKTGSPPASTETSLPTQTDIVDAVDRMLAESEARQNRQTLVLLQRLTDNLEYKRQMDLVQVKDELGLLHQNYFQTLEKNSVMLEQAAKLMRQNRY